MYDWWMGLGWEDTWDCDVGALRAGAVLDGAGDNMDRGGQRCLFDNDQVKPCTLR